MVRRRASVVKDVICTGMVAVVAMSWILGGTAASDWTICPQGCKCKWVSGKKSADCSHAGHRSIPRPLSTEIQSLDLSENQLDRMSSAAFSSLGLVNLHKIYLRDCKIKELHKDAFKSLGILVEVDLSENKIHILHPGTFQDNIRLRLFSINRNPIKKIEANLFNNLLHLQNVEFTNCMLTEIDEKAFRNVTNLLHLKINGNQLVQVKTSTFTDLMKLRSLVLHENPWKCDCHLREFRNWVIERNLYAVPTACYYPEHLRNKMWNVMKPEDFACKPEIVWPPFGTVINAESRDVSLGCKVSGDPPPEVHWVHNSRIISDNGKSKYNVNRFSIRSDPVGRKERWVNLTVSGTSGQDKGQFRCVAKSPGGIDERNVSLAVEAEGEGLMGLTRSGDHWPVILGLSTGLTALLVLGSATACWLCCRPRPVQAKKSSHATHPVNGQVLLKTSPGEQEKSLLTVNPVQKPPRRYEPQLNPNNEPIEVSDELNRNLLDQQSLQGNSCPGEEEPEVEYVIVKEEAEKPPVVAVAGGAGGGTPVVVGVTPPVAGDQETYPPDLLAFRQPGDEPLAPAALPAAVSRVEHNQHLYPTVRQHGYGTLPYSRSHSPFSPSSSISEGYVTMPRRPRIPSSSVSPTGSTIPMSDAGRSCQTNKPGKPTKNGKTEPAYDNLGPRTTASGTTASLSPSNPTQQRRHLPPSAYQLQGRRGWPAPGLRSEGTWRPSDTSSLLKRATSAESDLALIRSRLITRPPSRPGKDCPIFQDDREDGTQV